MTDYCGSTGTEWVPDYYPNSCRIHDMCYRTVGMTQQHCDAIFLTNMQNESGDTLLPFIYFIAVSIFGAFAYRTAQKRAKVGS